MRTLIFATTNEGKLQEAREILGIQIKGIKLKIDEIQTLDPLECAQRKALEKLKQAIFS